MIGNPDADHISTSYVEAPRHLTMRMSMRRFTRLTNASARKLRKTTRPRPHLYMIVLQFSRRKHMDSEKPASRAGWGRTDRIWSIEEIVAILATRNRVKLDPARKAS